MNSNAVVLFSYLSALILLSIFSTLFTERASVAYNGGRINAAPQVIQVLWGAGEYEPHLTRSAAPSMESFYSALLTDGALFHWRKILFPGVIDVQLCMYYVVHITRRSRFSLT